MLNAQGVFLGTGQNWSRTFQRVSINRRIVLLPDVLIQDFAQPLESTCRPIFDAVWNAGGYPKSMNYDDNGNWIAR
jgi:hypothetical protein